MKKTIILLAISLAVSLCYAQTTPQTNDQPKVDTLQLRPIKPDVEAVKSMLSGVALFLIDPKQVTDEERLSHSRQLLAIRNWLMELEKGGKR